MLALMVALQIATASPCSWDHPGSDPYRHSGQAVSAALHDYHLPPATQQALQRKMDTMTYDDVVEIRRDSIQGHHTAYEHLRGMHSGHGRYCAGPTQQTHWSPTHVERGLVYCEGETCVVVPTVCNNVALLSKKPDEINIEPAAGPTVTPSTPMALAPLADTPALPDTVVEAPAQDLPDLIGGGYFASAVPPYLPPDDGGGLPRPINHGSGGGGGGEVLPPVVIPPVTPPLPPIPAVPEPAMGTLLALGGVVVALRLVVGMIRQSSRRYPKRPPQPPEKVSRFGGLRRRQ